MRVRGLPLVVGSALVAGAGLVLAGLRRRWVHVTVDGPSMLPALSPGDRLLARRSPAAAVRTGDIVLARGPAGQAWLSPGRPSDRVMIKRAVAVPGDQVPPGVVAERGVELHGTVPEGLFVLLGDNPDDSVDSRMLGYCPGTSIIGVVPRRAAPARSPVPARANPWRSTGTEVADMTSAAVPAARSIPSQVQNPPVPPSCQV